MTRILYVDDEADLREIAVMSLELDPEFEVRAAASGAEALEQARQWQPELILLDVMMPGMDGPAAFHTAKTHPRHVTDLKARGVRAVLATPFDPMTLSGTVRALLQP